MSASTPDLFSPLDPGNPEAPIRIGGKWESPDRLGGAFLEAADLLAAGWRAEREHGRELPIALPIIQGYRHAIELILKASCFEIRRLQRFSRKLGYGTKTEPKDLETDLGSTHSIAVVIKILNSLMSGLDVDKETSELPDEVRETLDYLHDADERGTAFRYATQRVPKIKPPVWEPVRPEVTLIHLDSAITRLHDAANLLVYGLGGYLDAYEEILRDLWTEYCAEMDYYV